MSCDYNVHCRTCNDTHKYSDANHREDLMRTLINHRHAIAAIAPLIHETDNVEFKTFYGYIDVDWFDKHKEHELVVRDEYGRDIDQCSKDTRCPHCNHRDWCKLPINHDGKCDIKQARY